MADVVDCRFTADVRNKVLVPTTSTTTAMPMMAVAMSSSTRVEPCSSGAQPTARELFACLLSGPRRPATAHHLIDRDPKPGGLSVFGRDQPVRLRTCSFGPAGTRPEGQSGQLERVQVAAIVSGPACPPATGLISLGCAEREMASS